LQKNYVLSWLWAFWSFKAKRIARSVDSVLTLNSDNEFARLCAEFGSDKGGVGLVNSLNPDRKPHNYSRIYNQLFFGRRDAIKDVLECGIGSNNSTVTGFMGLDAQVGASLRVWRAFFTNAQIVGVDIDKESLFSEDRISTFQVDQLSAESIFNFKNKIGSLKFDLIVDDGLHSYPAGVSFFEGTYSLLRPGGIYVIEDVHAHDALAFQEYFMRTGHLTEIHELGSSFSRADDRMIVIRKN
jgi:SAM-dependent methyltransferase